MKPQQGGSVRAVQVEREDGHISEFTDRDGIEQTIWNNIHWTRFFLAEQAPICSGDPCHQFGYNAEPPAAGQVLNGHYAAPEEVDPATMELFEAIAGN